MLSILSIKRSWAELDSNVRLLYIFTLTYYATVGILKEHLLSGFVGANTKYALCHRRATRAESQEKKFGGFFAGERISI